MIEVEAAVLGSLIVNPELLPDVQDLLVDSDFSTQGHREIYGVITEKAAKGNDIDIITIAEALNNLEYLTELTTARTPNIVAHAKILAGYGLQRRLVARLDEAKTNIMDCKDPDDMISHAGRVVADIEVKGEEFKPFSEMAKDAVRRLDERMKGNAPVGLQTGFTRIDERLMGIASDDLVIVAGRPSMGKTTYAMNIAENVARAGGNVLVFSMEMSEQQLVDRMHASLSGVDQRSLKIGKYLTEDEQTRAHAGFIHMNSMKKNILIIDRPAMELSHLTNIAKKCNRKRKLDLIVIDYLQLMRVKASSRFEEISAVSRGLKALAKTVHAPVIALSQLSRSVDSRAEKIPVNSDLRESGQIEQDADIIQFLYREEVYNKDTPNAGLCDVLTTKFRNGEIGTDTLEAQLHMSRFLNTKRFSCTPESAPSPRPYKID